jgi:DNA-binding winged helix-turn-helix (wHTH) protein/tetratricopeptide (TPR) repeat protein
MADQTHGNPRIRFGDFEIDREACALFRNGQRIPLQIQPFHVLETLIDNAGQVVTRATLHARIWPGTVYIDVDRGLNNAVNRLRQALGDSGDTAVYIETLPRIGYRFIYPVTPPATDKSPGAESPLRPAAETGRRRALRTGVVALTALAVALVAVGVAWWSWNSTDAEPGADVTGRPARVAEAQDAYSRAQRLLAHRNKESMKLAIEHLQRATELDPTFAEAFAELAAVYASAGSNAIWRSQSADSALKPALAAAERALQLDPDLGKAHIALARVLNAFEPWSRPTDLAIEQSFLRGLELEPADAEAHLQFGNFLAKRGRHDEAMAQFQAAQELEPLSASINSRLGQELMGLGRITEGLELLRRTVELDPFQFNARIRLGWGYVTVGDLYAAEREFLAADGISPDSPSALSSLAFVAARKGREAHARKLLDRLQPDVMSTEFPLDLAIVYVGLRDREKSLEWLEKTAHETRFLHGRPPWGLHAPMYDWLRGDARFRRLERDIAATLAGGQPEEPAP